MLSIPVPTSAWHAALHAAAGGYIYLQCTLKNMANLGSYYTLLKIIMTSQSYFTNYLSFDTTNVNFTYHITNYDMN